MLVPLYGFLAGDSLGVMVLVHDDQTIRELAACLQQAASPRVKPTPRAQVLAHGRCLEQELTVARAGLTALDRVDVVPIREEEG